MFGNAMGKQCGKSARKGIRRRTCPFPCTPPLPCASITKSLPVTTNHDAWLWINTTRYVFCGWSQYSTFGSKLRRPRKSTREDLRSQVIFLVMLYLPSANTVFPYFPQRLIAFSTWSVSSFPRPSGLSVHSRVGMREARLGEAGGDGEE